MRAVALADERLHAESRRRPPIPSSFLPVTQLSPSAIFGMPLATMPPDRHAAAACHWRRRPGIAAAHATCLSRMPPPPRHAEAARVLSMLPAHAAFAFEFMRGAHSDLLRILVTGHLSSHGTRGFRAGV